MSLWTPIPSSLFAIAQSGEKTSNVIKAIKMAMLTMGVPWAIKTDNGPAYNSSSFQQFLKSWGIYHTTGIPYNPQGQGIIERTNLTLKETLQKQNDIHICLDPNLALTHVLFILNFRTFDSNGVSPAYKHWGSFPSLTPLPLVYWKDPLTGTWQGPHPLITQG